MTLVSPSGQIGKFRPTDGLLVQKGHLTQAIGLALLMPRISATAKLCRLRICTPNKPQLPPTARNAPEFQPELQIALKHQHLFTFKAAFLLLLERQLLLLELDRLLQAVALSSLASVSSFISLGQPSPDPLQTKSDRPHPQASECPASRSAPADRRHNNLPCVPGQPGHRTRWCRSRSRRFPHPEAPLLKIDSS